MRIENEKTIINVNIFNKKKFEISYREFNQEFVHNKQTFVYEIGIYFFSKIDNKINKRQSIVITQDCLEKQYQPLKFTKIFNNEEESLKVYNRKIEVERNNFRHLLLEHQTIESIEVDYKNFEYYCQSIDNNPDKNIYIINYINEIVEKNLNR